MTMPIHVDRQGTSPAGTQKDGCCGGKAHAEGESRPEHEGCGGGAPSEPPKGQDRGGCCGGHGEHGEH